MSAEIGGGRPRSVAEVSGGRWWRSLEVDGGGRWRSTVIGESRRRSVEVGGGR